MAYVLFTRMFNIMRKATPEYQLQSAAKLMLINRSWSRFNINTSSVIRIRRSWDRVIVLMGIRILVTRYLYIETAAWGPSQ